jgi:RHS repeat-associated protein
MTYTYDRLVPRATFAYKFTGKERDTESGLDNFGARFNASSMGRFMSPDPDQESGIDNMGDPQMWNGYSYVGNSPLSRTDPSGRAGTGASLSLS